MFIGLLMNSHEDDVLEATLANNLQFCDTFYVLDGTVPNTESKAICEATGKLGGYITDVELPKPPFTEKPVCGYRRAIHELAVADHGTDHWFLILHGDEWWEFDPRDFAGQSDADCYVFNLPFYFPRDEWDYNQHPLDQLKWNFRPGYPEPRMFKGSDDVFYDARQQWNAAPQGLKNVEDRPEAIRHYLFRSPDNQRARAARHVETGFDPDNYQHITSQDRVYFDAELIQKYQSSPMFAQLVKDD